MTMTVGVLSLLLRGLAGTDAAGDWGACHACRTGTSKYYYYGASEMASLVVVIAQAGQGCFWGVEHRALSRGRWS
jgi:hypothetical protein